MINQELFEAVWERDEGRCRHCGVALEKERATLGRVFPRRFGGADFADNMLLLCPDCKRHSAGSFSLSEAGFQHYLQTFLQQDARFDNVESNVRLWTNTNQQIMADVLFTRTVNGSVEHYFVEAKCMLSATDRNIEAACRQISYYRSLFPDYHFILAMPIFPAEQYRQLIRVHGITLWDREALRLKVPDMALPVCAAPDAYDELIGRLKDCSAGPRHWTVYQKLVGEILEALFCPPLDPPSEQNADANYANRRDFILPNYADRGYWAFLRDRYQAEFVVVDAKNSADVIGKDDVLQVAHYLKEKGVGLFGLIFARYGTDDRTYVHLRDVWQSEGKMLVVLNDNDVEQMLLNRQNGIDPTRIIIEKVQELRQSI